MIDLLQPFVIFVLLQFSLILMLISFNIIYSLFSLIFTLVFFLFFFFFLKVYFLGLILLLLYVGAITVLFLFVIMLLPLKRIENPFFFYQMVGYYVFFLLFFLVFIYFSVESPMDLNLWYPFDYDFLIFEDSASLVHFKKLGVCLFSYFISNLFLLSFLLLGSLIGSVFIVNSRRAQSYKKQVEPFYRSDLFFFSFMER